MSTKQLLAEAVAALPESLTLEEAVDRLYRAFKQKRALNREEPPGGMRRADPLAALVGLLREPADTDAYLFETRGPAFDPTLDGGSVDHRD